MNHYFKDAEDYQQFKIDTLSMVLMQSDFILFLDKNDCVMYKEITNASKSGNVLFITNNFSIMQQQLVDAEIDMTGKDAVLVLSDGSRLKPCNYYNDKALKEKYGVSYNKLSNFKSCFA